MILSTHQVFTRDELLPDWVKVLVFPNPEYNKKKALGLSVRGLDDSIAIHTDKDGLYYVPRNFRMPEAVMRNVTEIRDEMTDGLDVTFHSRIALKPEQAPAVDALVVSDNGLLEAGCGKGKTVMCLEAIARTGKTALVLVHKEFLLKQWQDRIKQFLGEEAGIIRQDKCDYEGRKIVVAMIPSLVNPEKYPKEMFSYFGVVVTDEVHRIGSKEWSKVIQLFPARRRWGLTATVKRADRMEFLVFAHIGNVVHSIKGESLVPRVVFIDTQTTVNMNNVIMRWSQEISQPKLITLLSKDMERTRKILVPLSKALESGRKVLVLSHRLEHLKSMKRRIEEMTGAKAMLYIGATPQKERDRAEEFDVIFGQMDLVKEGLDIPSLDTLFLTTPVGSDVTIQQGTGRILREFEGKKEPLILDFVDMPVGYCVGMYNRRKKLYKKLGYKLS